MTSAELGEALEVSPAAVSGAVRYLHADAHDRHRERERGLAARRLRRRGRRLARRDDELATDICAQLDAESCARASTPSGHADAGRPAPALSRRRSSSSSPSEMVRSRSEWEDRKAELTAAGPPAPDAIRARASISVTAHGDRRRHAAVDGDGIRALALGTSWRRDHGPPIRSGPWLTARRALRVRPPDRARVRRVRPWPASTRRPSSARRAQYPYTRGVYPTCTPGGRGRCGSTPGSARRRSPTSATTSWSARHRRTVRRLRPADPDGLRLRRGHRPRRGRQGRRRDRLDRRHAHPLRRAAAGRGVDVDDDQRARLDAAAALPARRRGARRHAATS